MKVCILLPALLLLAACTAPRTPNAPREKAIAGERGIAERARMLEQFSAAMQSCKESDPSLKKECERAVLQQFDRSPAPKEL